MSREQFLTVESELKSRFIDRDDEIRGLSLAALSGQHLLMLGPPGNAKTQLIKAFTEYLGGACFKWSLNEFTAPDEILGPVSLQGLKSDIYRRNTAGKLPEADVGYLDEIFKANSPILNTLLPILQERVFFNDSVETPVPLLFLMGSSNELPPEDEGLAALYDRFVLRYNPGYISDPGQFAQLLTLKNGQRRTEPITRETLIADRAIVAGMSTAVGPDTIESLTLVWSRLREEAHVVLSDRRWRQTLLIMAAESWLSGATEVTPESLLVGIHVFWDKPDQIRTVSQIVRSCINPGLAKARAIETAATEAMRELSSLKDVTQFIQLLTQLRQLRTDIGGLTQTAPVVVIRNQLDSYIQTVREKL